jgi:hypothetical protein
MWSGGGLRSLPAERTLFTASDIAILPFIWQYMSADPAVVELHGAEYVLKADYDALNEKYTSLKHKCRTFIEGAASESGLELAGRRVRRCTAAAAAAGDAAAEGQAAWQLTKLQGRGFRQDGLDAEEVQVYRIDCGASEQPEEAADASGAADSSAQDRYLFRPRDALQVLTTHELWQPGKLGVLEDKVRVCMTHLLL